MQFIAVSTGCLAVSSRCWSGAPVTRVVEEGGHLCIHGWGGMGGGGWGLVKAAAWRMGVGESSSMADGLIVVIVTVSLGVRVRFPSAWPVLV